ncbi:membrane protein [Bacteroidia bacterium]|nr:membrane protein [Bacteroidia bacterium]
MADYFDILKEFFLNLHWYNFLDIAVVLLLFYLGYKLLKGTGANLIFLTILFIIIVWRVVLLLNMQLTAGILGSIINVGIVAIIIIFQPEIRRFLILLGSGKLLGKATHWKILNRFFRVNADTLNVNQIVDACADMSKTKTGALIILAKENELEYATSSGENVDSCISKLLLENIFYKNSPLHDGAVIIRDNRIVAARCILPVSQNENIPASLGLRHRAAFGITEQTDALAIVVSEQTGAISVVKGGIIERKISPEHLSDILQMEFKNMEAN